MWVNFFFLCPVIKLIKEINLTQRSFRENLQDLFQLETQLLPLRKIWCAFHDTGTLIVQCYVDGFVCNVLHKNLYLITHAQPYAVWLSVSVAHICISGFSDIMCSCCFVCVCLRMSATVTKITIQCKLRHPWCTQQV